MNKKTFGIALIAAAVLTLTACSSTYKNSTSSSSAAKETVKKTNSETQYPLTVKTYDDQGTELDQVFKKAPEKVITNNLSSTEILIELGLKDKIVGMLNPDNEVTDKYKEDIASIPHIGDKKTISQEAILAYGPDALIGRNMMFSDKSMGTISTWNSNDIPVYTQKVQDKADKYAGQLQKRIDAVKKKNKSSDKDLKKALIMCAYNDETFGTYKSALQESMLNQLGYTNVATGTSDLTLENLVSMEPELIIYVTSDRNKAMDKDATDKMEKNAVLENVPAVKNKKIMTISYDELMDYGPSVIDSLEKVNDFVNK